MMVCSNFILQAVSVLAVITYVYTDGNPCCSFPCQNRGVCMTKGFDNYYCDCTDTGHTGAHCEVPSFLGKIKRWIKPSPEFQQRLLQSNDWLWDTINSMDFLLNFIMRKVYTIRSKRIDSPPTYDADHDYITSDAYYNLSTYTRALPPVPKNCPTPMGVAGKEKLPDVDILIEKFFRRTKFIPDTAGTSALFPFFAQHFTHQFFKTDYKRGPQYQWGGHGIDCSHIYGPDEAARKALRSFKDGKLKSQMINGEEFPPLVKDAPVHMIYGKNVPEKFQFALGHEFFGILPGLLMFSTIWLREHNRVCDILKGEHPEWDDERLYHTARLIIIGETLNIAVVDYIQHLSAYKIKLKFDPELLFSEHFQYQNRIAIEFDHLYHWHPMMPGEFQIGNDTYKVENMLYRPDILVKHGVREFVQSVTRQRAGRFGPNNHAPVTIPVVKRLIEHGRHLRLQPINQYKKRFDMKPFESFMDLTGDEAISQELKSLYGDIDSLEFYVGFILEKKSESNLFPLSLFEMGGPFSVKGIMANPLCSPKYWKPSTFGGDIGFEIVKTATLKKLFCQNIKEECPDVSFKVPLFNPKRNAHNEL